MLNTFTVFAKYFSFLMHPGSIEVGVIAVQYVNGLAHFEAKDGGVRRAEIHLLKASANRRILKILVPRRKIPIPFRNIAIRHQVFVRRASNARRGIAKRTHRPIRNRSPLNALILQKLAPGAQCKWRILRHRVIGTIPSAILQKGERERRDVLCGARVDGCHKLVVE